MKEPMTANEILHHVRGRRISVDEATKLLKILNALPRDEANSAARKAIMSATVREAK